MHIDNNAGINLHHLLPLRSNDVSVVLFARLFASCLAPSLPMQLPANHMHDLFTVWMT